jgi:hypothetical protein
MSPPWQHLGVAGLARELAAGRLSSVELTQAAVVVGRVGP